METTTLTIHLPMEVSDVLAKKARSSGKEMTVYIEQLLERQANLPSSRGLFADIQSDFEKSGMSEEELTELINREIKAVREERRRRALSEND